MLNLLSHPVKHSLVQIDSSIKKAPDHADRREGQTGVTTFASSLARRGHLGASHEGNRDNVSPFSNEEP
jgi:hypothetical protein